VVSRLVAGAPRTSTTDDGYVTDIGCGGLDDAR
jgi:hypothetical protein